MIFKNIFAPSYQSSDPEKRIASINRLNKLNEKDKSILHELAFNDENDKVSLAALEKLDSFVLWMKSAETSSSARIKKHAQQLCTVYLEQKHKVDDAFFVAFVSESKNKTFLESLVFSSKRLQQQPKLCLQLLFSLQNDNHIRRFFQELADTDQQLEIVDTNEDPKVLTRFAKLTKDENVQQHIQIKLARLADLKDKPIKIKQQATLVNSRLLALKDAQDYEYLLANFTELTQEFEQVKAEFSLLDEISSSTFTQKYLTLKVSLQQKLADLEVDHVAKTALQKTTNDLSDIQQRCTDVQQQIDLIVLNCEKDPARNIDAEVKILELALDAANVELQHLQTEQQTHAHAAHIKKLEGLMKSLHAKLDSLPELANAASQASLVVSRMKDLLAQQSVHEKLSQEALVRFNKDIDGAKQSFNQVQKQCENALPATIVQDFAHVLQQLYQANKQFSAYYIQIQKKCENKLRVVNRMVNDGKYTGALSTFHYVQKIYSEIADYAKPPLKRLFENTKEEVTKLQDWQAYIAQPRKPILIEQVKSVLKATFEDPYERAEQVKQFRSEWVSLGNLHTDEDSAHNQEFDRLIERAFAPCRAFFSELEKQREQNYQTALTIIEQAKKVDENLPATQVASTIASLRSAFRKIGDIDNAKSNKAKRAFNNALKPLNTIVANAQLDNARLKQILIDKTTTLLASVDSDEELKEAIQQAKSLQQNYKAIGFAGKGDDNKLWQEFREVNDALFARYHASISAQKSIQQEHSQHIESMLIEIQDKLKAVKQHADLQFYEDDHLAVVTQLSEMEEMTRKKILPMLSKVEQQFDNCVKKLDVAKEVNTLKTLFIFMQEYTDPTLPKSFETLLGRHKSWVKGDLQSPKLLQGLNRIALTQVAAILHEKSIATASVGDESMRKNLQLKMMAYKLEGNEPILPEDVLACWISLGPLVQEEQDSLAAMMEMYCINE